MYLILFFCSLSGEVYLVSTSCTVMATSTVFTLVRLDEILLRIAAHCR